MTHLRPWTPGGLAGATLVLGTLAAACGSDRTATGYLEAGTPPVVESPALACAHVKAGCSCSPTDASATRFRCDDTIVPGARCCAGPDYPFAGECTCSARSCDDGGAAVSSCSTPPDEIAPAACDPAECGGSSCAGGYCCTSSCQNGVCQATCGQ